MLTFPIPLWSGSEAIIHIFITLVEHQVLSPYKKNHAKRGFTKSLKSIENQEKERKTKKKTKKNQVKKPRKKIKNKEN